MNNLTERQLDFIREDLANNMMYTKIQMINNYIKQLKLENPQISSDEVIRKIKEFRKLNKWDE